MKNRIACIVLLSIPLAAQSPFRTTRHAGPWSLPSIPAFAGLQLHYQAAIDDPVNGFHLSNAIRDSVQ